MQNIEEIKNVLLNECSVDYVGLWEVISHVEYETKQSDPQTVRETVMVLITKLLREGLIKAGAPKDTGGFVAWQLSPEETVKRIHDEWNALGREPDLGDIVWFTTTEAGDAQVAASHVKKESEGHQG